MTSVSLYDEPLGSNAGITLPSYHVFFFLDIVVVVETSNSPYGSGTDAEIRIKIFGTKGNVPDRIISGRFEKGR